MTISGEEPEPEEAMMGRCSVCSEKQHLINCHHCSKKICADCKEAHLDVMRREIARICSNVSLLITLVRVETNSNSTLVDILHQTARGHNCSFTKSAFANLISIRRVGVTEHIRSQSEVQKS